MIMRKALFGCSVLMYCFTGAFAQVLKEKMRDKLVVLTFDDAVVSHATYVAPLLKKYGFGATFFVCEFVDPPFSDKTKYMSWEQIAELNKMGFEIGNHTWYHTHVNKMNKAKFIAELDYIENKCAEYHIPKPVSFAYPGYDTSRRAVEVLKEKGYLFARAGFDRGYDPATDSPFVIPGFTTRATNKPTIDSAIQKAINGKIIVLTIHGVPDDAHPWVNTPPSIFEGYLKYLKENHYKVIALRDLKKYINTDVALTKLNQSN
jgi:peptidoglycan/xylan/chitin deacetylase (PgdA/CDA1 family)